MIGVCTHLGCIPYPDQGGDPNGRGLLPVPRLPLRRVRPHPPGPGGGEPPGPGLRLPGRRHRAYRLNLARPPTSRSTLRGECEMVTELRKAKILRLAPETATNPPLLTVVATDRWLP